MQTTSLESESKQYQISWKQYWSTVKPRIILGGVFVIIFALSAGLRFDPFILKVIVSASIVGLFALIILGIKLWSRYLPTKVIVSKDTITYKSLFRKKRVSLSDDVIGFLGVYSYPGALYLGNLLFLKSVKTGVTIRLNGAYWDVEDLEAIAIAANIDMYNPLETTLTLASVNKKYPGLFGYRENHSGAYVVIIFLAVIVLLAVLGVVAAIIIANLA